MATTETLNPPPTNDSTLNGDSTTSDQPIPQEDAGNVSPPQLDTTPTAESEPGEKRKRTEPESDEKTGSIHPLWKTSLCSYFRRSGGECSHGETCRFAHGEEELRPRPDNTWDPTSERAKKLLKVENEDRAKVSDEEIVMMTEAISEEGSSASALDKCLVNLPMKWGSDKLRSFLNEQGIQYKSAKKKEGMLVGFASFETVEQMDTAVKELEGKAVGNKQLKIADVIRRSPGSSVSKCKSAHEVVTPLAHMSYTDQLEHKKNSLVQVLKKLTRNARKACPNGVPLPEWIGKSGEIGGLPCKLEGIIESPLVNGYRNKCEFTVGYSLQGKPTVGFSLGNFREGVTAVEEPVDCPNVSRIACKYATILQEFLQNSSLPIWNRMNNTGFWRQLTVREGRTPGKIAEVENVEANISEVLLMVQISSAGFDDKVVNVELEKMTEAFVVGGSSASPSLPLTALVIQDHQGISNVAPDNAPLRSLPLTKAEDGSVENTAVVAEARIHDYISNLQFSISPTAFFQVNTLAAEKLYSLAGEWAGLGPDTLLFDVCCGTGTIGLTLAHHVGMVVGIEMNASAVADAKRNAEINGIKNCKFVCSKAEDVMGSLLKEYLNLTQKADDQLIESHSNDEDSTSSEGKSASKESTTNPKESPVSEPKAMKDDHENIKEGSQEHENQPKSNCISENGSHTVQQFKNVVAIVDPPRSGLHPTVIKALRTHSRLKRLVYISCNPESLVANAIELCTPSADKLEKGYKDNRGWRFMSSAGLARHRAKSMPNSEPFHPIKTMAVDLFPHTQHCEVVMLLER